FGGFVAARQCETDGQRSDQEGVFHRRIISCAAMDRGCLPRFAWYFGWRRAFRMTSASDRMPTKTALVTGASRGIGRGIAIELARSGCRVAINYAGNTEAAAEAVA